MQYTLGFILCGILAGVFTGITAVHLINVPSVKCDAPAPHVAKLETQIPKVTPVAGPDGKPRTSVTVTTRY